MHMLIYNKETDVLLERAIKSCREAQNYVRPIVIDQNKYRSGVTCDQKLATLVSIANDNATCASLRPALECLDDLVFQMKCVSMEPILAMVEQIEWNVNKLIQQRTSAAQKSIRPGEIFKGETEKRKHAAAADQWTDSFCNFADDSAHGITSAASSDGTDPFDYEIRTSSNPDPFQQAQTVDDDDVLRGGSFSESMDGESLGREPHDGNETDGSDLNILDTLNASQAIINGLLSSLDDSGETLFLEIVKATLEKKDEDCITEQRTFDNEADAVDAQLRKADDDKTRTDSSRRKSVRNGSYRDKSKSDIDFEAHNRRTRLNDDIQSKVEASEGSETEKSRSRSKLELNDEFTKRVSQLFEVRKKVYRRMKRIDQNNKPQKPGRAPKSPKGGRLVLEESGNTFLELLKASEKKRTESSTPEGRRLDRARDSGSNPLRAKNTQGVESEVVKVKKNVAKAGAECLSSTKEGAQSDEFPESPVSKVKAFSENSREPSPVQENQDLVPHQTAIHTILQEKFFDRLHHLFDVRKKVQLRMERIDPNDRLQQIEPIAHSDGIRNQDGSFKSEYQQRNEIGEVASNLAQIYAAARQCKSCFLGFLYEVCDKVKGLDHFDAQIAPLKPHDRASEKAKSEYTNRSPGPCETWLYDILRGTITCKTVKQMESINKYLSKKAQIVQGKNRFLTPAYNGYRDLLYHVKIPYEYKVGVFFIAEIQIQHREVIALQNSFGLNAHLLYFRSCFAGRSTESTLRDLEQLERHGKLDDEFISDLLKSGNSEKLALFAQILHEKLECRRESLELYSRVLKLQKSEFGAYHAKTGATYQKIGLLQCQQGDFETSLMNLNKALEIQQKVYGSRHPIVATTRSHIGNLICLKGGDGGSTQGQRRALRQHKSSLAIRKETLGTQHVDVATSYQNIGLSLGRLGDFDGSVTAYREAIRILQNVLEPNHPDVAATHSMIGTVLCQQGKFDEAMKEFSKGHEIREDRLGKNHPETADSHTEIGNMHCALGNFLKAEWRHREALRIRGAVYGRDHPDYAVSLSNIGYVLNQRGDFDGALVEHRTALEIREATLGKRHRDTVASRKSIVAALNKVHEV